MKLLQTAIALLLAALVLPLGTSAYSLQSGVDEYYCVTPFALDHTVSGEGGGTVYAGACCPRVYRLEYAGASLPAYSLDASTRLGEDYTRGNLEDAPGWDAETAGRLRAVILAAFPCRSIQELQTQANAWLQKQGLPEIQSLQSGEAVLATQAVLWKIAGGERETIRSLYAGVTSDPENLGVSLLTAMAHQQPTDATAGNIESLYTYLYSLSPEAVKQDVASASSLEAPTYSWVRAGERYTLTVLVTVNTSVGPRDSLCLTAECGGETQSQPVSAAGSVRFVFRDMEQVGPVTLTLSGEQWGGDVYRFWAEGSQSLIAYDDSCQWVNAQLTLYPGRSSASAPISRENTLGVQLNVGQTGSASASFAVGESHTWIIRTNVPGDLGAGCRYEITGVLDSRLDYRSGSPTVRLYTRAGTPVLLRREDHYTLEEVDDNFFRIVLTPAGMAYVKANLGEGNQEPELHIRFLAAINELAAMGESIPNVVHFAYTDAAGELWETDSGIASVSTGGIRLYNTDDTGAAVHGTRYRLARPATTGELASPNCETIPLNVGEQIRSCVYVPFYASADLGGEPVWEVTTDAQGEALFYGLPYGEYYLVQTQSAEGLILNTQPISATVDSGSHTRENQTGAVSKRIVLPQTGGSGARVYHLLGGVLLVSAGFLLLVNHRRYHV